MQPRRELSLSDVPALGFAVASFSGAAASLVLSLSSEIALTISLAGFVVALAALLLLKQRRHTAIFVYSAVAAITLLRGNATIARDEREQLVKFDPDTAIVSCRGVVVWRDEARQSILSDRLWLEEVKLSLPDTIIECRRLRVRLNIPLADATKVRIGDVVACNVRLESMHKIQEHSVRELCWSLREQIVADARLKDSESLVVVPGDWSLNAAIYDARSRVLDVFERYLRPDARAVAGALLLGSREAFSAQFRKELQLTGLAHLFALSGLNTGLLISLLWLLLAWLRVPGRIRYLLLLLLLIGYTALGLGVPSLFRSALMAGLIVIARLLARPSHPVNLLLFAAGVELLIWPLHILDAGFILSYLSMAGILTAYLALQQPLQDLLKAGTQSLRRRTADTMSSTIGAQLATAPTAALLFGRVPGLAIIVNVIAIPLFSLLVVLILWMMVLDPFSTAAASIVGRSIEGLVGLFAWLTSSSAAVIGASLVSYTPLWASVAAITIQLLAIVVSLQGRIRVALISTLVAINLLIWPGLLVTPDAARVVTIRGKSGQVVFARVGEISAVIGCGAEWTSSQTVGILQSLMAQDGLQRVDFLVVNSRKIDQIGGAPDIIQAIKPEIALDLSSYRDTRASELLDAAIELSNASYVQGTVGATWRHNQSQLQIESRRDVETGSEWSIVLRSDSLNVRIASSIYSTTDASLIVNSGQTLNVPFQARARSESFTCDGGKWLEIEDQTLILMDLMRLPRNAKV